MTATPAIALAFADALEQGLGDGTLLTVGSLRGSITEVVGDEPVRVAALTFTTGDGGRGTIALVARAPLAERLENAASDELLVTSCGPALGAAAHTIGTLLTVDIESDPAREVDLESIVAAQDDDEMAIFPILDGTVPVACLVVVGARHASTTPTPDRRPAAIESAVVGGLDPATSLLLADVEMGVTAELGRCRMTVRELLSITAGAVIDLDRPADAPVDVVVNGTLIARGEVVVIDEEFGIRITELLDQESPPR
jgi:flagellar motor switch protein FliN/FliY